MASVWEIISSNLDVRNSIYSTITINIMGNKCGFKSQIIITIIKQKYSSEYSEDVNSISHTSFLLH